MKRIFLFAMTNIAILVVLTLFIKIFKLDELLQTAGGGLNLTTTLIFAAIFGMGGAFISLALSKTMAKSGMGVQVISADPQSPVEQWLVDTVKSQAQRAGIGMPEVGIFDSEQPNAFATGMNRDDALVAVSTGLLEQMSKEEVEAVLGHEISHVANGDMITMTLIQGVVNTFVFVLSRVVGHVVDKVIFKTERGYGPAYLITTIVAQVVLGFLATMITMWFSRKREFAADAGGAQLAGKENMIDSLRKLQQLHDPKPLPGELAAFGISGGLGDGLKRLFMSHPPLEERIAVLQRM